MSATHELESKQDKKYEYSNLDNYSINELKGFIDGVRYHMYENDTDESIDPDKPLGSDFIAGMMSLMEYYDLSPLEVKWIDTPEAA